MVIVDAKGNIAPVNGQTERRFGYQREEMVGKPMELLMPERFRGRHVSERMNYVKEPRARAMGSGSSCSAGARTPANSRSKSACVRCAPMKGC